MNAAVLFNDHTFHILLDDLFKARKSPELGPIRLQAVLDYAERKGQVTSPSGGIVPVKELGQAFFPPQPRQTTAPGFVLEGDEDERAPAPASAIGYVESQRALRESPDVALGRTADIVLKAMETGQWDGNGNMQVAVPKRMVTSGLEAFLKKERRAQFTALNVSLALRNATISPRLAGMTREQAEAHPGGQGHRVGDWVVTITK